MGFFFTAKKPARLTGGMNTSVALLHRAGCSACPLNNSAAKHPKMSPYGQGQHIYILTTTPTLKADRIGRPWAGPGKDLFMDAMPRAWRSRVRFSNIVRTPAGSTITPTMIECCRPSIIKDIEETQPVAIFGIGEQVLQWALKQSGIAKWTGRRIPVQIGAHKCWFFPFMDPTEVLKKRRYDWEVPEDQFALELAIKRACNDLDTLPEPIIHTKERARAGITQIDGSGGQSDLDLLQAAFDEMAECAYVGFDYETNRLRGFNRGAKILSFAISGKDNTYSVALSHKGSFWNKRERKEVHAMLLEWLYWSKCKKISHQLPFELEWSAIFYGNEVVRATRWEDTVTQAWLIDERNKMGKPDCHSLEFLTILYFGLNIKALSSMMTNDLDAAPLDLVLEYNGIDAKYHRALFFAQRRVIRAEELEHQYEKMLERIPTAVLTQIKGIPIHQPTVHKFKRMYEQNLELIEADIADEPAAKRFKKLQGKTFEPSNPKMVLTMIKTVLGESAIDKKEKESSGFEVLDRIDDPIAELILEHRSVAKTLSTYVLPVAEGSPLVYEDGLIHPQVSTTRTMTSRTASDEPNSQNWPKHKAGAIIRKQIAPIDPDERIVSFDFAGIQARNIAMESLDKAFIRSFWEDHDIHKDWACIAAEQDPNWSYCGGSLKKFLADQSAIKKARSKIKNGFVFPSFFGAQARSIGVGIGMDKEDVEAMQARLFKQFPQIKKWQGKIIKMFEEKGYVAGLTGIKRRAPCSPNQLINAPIQADEAWIVCDCWTRLSKKAIKMGDLRLQPNMEIHDDLTFIWHKRDIDKLAPIVIKEMISVPFKWAHVVPIAIEMQIGTNWHNLKEVGKYASNTFTDLGYHREDFA